MSNSGASWRIAASFSRRSPAVRSAANTGAVAGLMRTPSLRWWGRAPPATARWPWAGRSPAAFLRQLRADRMAELLATTSLTVGEIGAAVGWRDAAVAPRSFKQRYGVAPRIYASSCRRYAAKSATPLQPVP
ncbi:helix-turn-helix domain-containing protein [Brevibacterium aurantiacum]|uniref:HTH araC/xylS-type domain-containing protein n=3 Tax=Actinomycetes TaxID=1760 RepID=A0A2A3X2E8_BREAU|nr:hypothetical protein CXR24_00765 [Brevibacterium aurantiacum]PMQ19783.1 hypothetical protein CIK84_14180 [Glutamicibacter arilaitensis]AZL11499.1 hypothetical protein CXR25_00725 [Brevibacterium aurantiacum]AZT95688.1 hypothetical protein CXR27_00730 [Brevibacterium aurantiacum]PCC18354.1 hypothetical protein CIK79_08660 [Brevibacterium aurantiacum]